MPQLYVIVFMDLGTKDVYPLTDGPVRKYTAIMRKPSRGEVRIEE